MTKETGKGSKTVPKTSPRAPDSYVPMPLMEIEHSRRPRLVLQKGGKEGNQIQEGEFLQRVGVDFSGSGCGRGCRIEGGSPPG